MSLSLYVLDQSSLALVIVLRVFLTIFNSYQFIYQFSMLIGTSCNLHTLGIKIILIRVSSKILKFSRRECPCKMRKERESSLLLWVQQVCLFDHLSLFYLCYFCILCCIVCSERGKRDDHIP